MARQTRRSPGGLVLGDDALGKKAKRLLSQSHAAEALRWSRRDKAETIAHKVAGQIGRGSGRRGHMMYGVDPRGQTFPPLRQLRDAVIHICQSANVQGGCYR